MRKVLALLGLLAVAAAAGTAQGAGVDLPALKRAEMRKLQIIAGEWRGTGWIAGPDGTRQEFRQRECIRPRVAGLVYLIEGFAWAKDAGPDAAPIFEAMMVIHYDEKAQAFSYRTFESVRGAGSEGALAIDGTTVTWGQPAGSNARMTYRIAIDGDTWHETGTYEAEGKAPMHVFDMKVERTAATCSGF